MDGASGEKRADTSENTIGGCIRLIDHTLYQSVFRLIGSKKRLENRVDIG
jgi:hypothetical protein